MLNFDSADGQYMESSMRSTYHILSESPLNITTRTTFLEENVLEWVKVQPYTSTVRVILSPVPTSSNLWAKDRVQP